MTAGGASNNSHSGEQIPLTTESSFHDTLVPQTTPRWVPVLYWTLQLLLTYTASSELLEPTSSSASTSTPKTSSNNSHSEEYVQGLIPLVASLVVAPIVAFYVCRKFARSGVDFRLPVTLFMAKLVSMVSAILSLHFITKESFKSGKELIIVMALVIADFGLIAIDIWCETYESSSIKIKAMLYGFLQLTLTHASTQELFQKSTQIQYDTFIGITGAAFALTALCALFYSKNKGLLFKSNETLLGFKVACIPTVIIVDLTIGKSVFKSALGLVYPVCLILFDFSLILLEIYWDHQQQVSTAK